MYEPAIRGPIRLLEVGVLRGASIAAWLEWLPEAQITALDTFERVAPESVPVLNDPRVSWVRGDSTQPLELPGLFDVIIDDGCHEHDAQRATFENLIRFLKPGGVYFIEDVWPFDVMSRKEKEHPWLTAGYSDEAFARLLAALAPFDVRRHDLRPGPDSYLIEVRHG